MKRISLFIAWFTVAAQGQTAIPKDPWMDENVQRIERMLQEWQLERQAPWRREILERQVAETRQREFTARANKFVEVWNRFVHSYRNGAFDVKAARELSKAFHDLEAAGWPKK